MTLRWLPLATVAILALVASDSSAQTCDDTSTRTECVRNCPTVRTCRSHLTATCTGSDCSPKAIRKACKRQVKRCKASCRTACLRSCGGQHPDCIAALTSALPECDPDNGDDVPLYCWAYHYLCFKQTVEWCREEGEGACCRPFPTEVAITNLTCEESECVCLPGGEKSRRWTYVMSGTVGGGIETRILADGRIKELHCEGWTEEEIPLQGPSCVRTDETQPAETAWHATGSESFPSDCYCLDPAWVTDISVIAHGISDTATDNEPVTCP
jgi:hypothetical protein